MTADRLDGDRDAAALVRAFHDRDHEAVQILLRHGDNRATAEALAETLAAIIVGAFKGCHGCTDNFITTWQEALRTETAEPVKGPPPPMARTEQEAIEAARRPRGCGRCGRTFGNGSAYVVHFESGEGSACLPGDAYGQLEQRDGVWVVPGAPGR